MLKHLLVYASVVRILVLKPNYYGIKHGLPRMNSCQVSREMLKSYSAKPLTSNMGGSRGGGRGSASTRQPQPHPPPPPPPWKSRVTLCFHRNNGTVLEKQLDPFVSLLEGGPYRPLWCWWLNKSPGPHRKEFSGSEHVPRSLTNVTYVNALKISFIETIALIQRRYIHKNLRMIWHYILLPIERKYLDALIYTHILIPEQSINKLATLKRVLLNF